MSKVSFTTTDPLVNMWSTQFKMCVRTHHFNIRDGPETRHINVGLDFSHWTYSGKKNQPKIMCHTFTELPVLNPSCLTPVLFTLVYTTLITGLTVHQIQKACNSLSHPKPFFFP